MKILIDTDVLLDVALGRPAFRNDSGQVLGWAEAAPGQAAVAWHSIANLAYLIRPDARPFIQALMEFVAIPPTGSKQMTAALGYPMRDLEDALPAAAAAAFGADFVVTRNLRDYRGAPVPALDPRAFLHKVMRH